MTPTPPRNVMREGDLEFAHRIYAYKQAASVLCEECGRGDVPEKRIEFSWRLSHVWPKEKGNGHTLCGASAIWEKLILPLCEGEKAMWPERKTE